MTLSEINKEWTKTNQRIDYETRRRNALIDAGLKPEADRVLPLLADLRRHLSELEAESQRIGDIGIAKTTMLYLMADMTLGAAYDYGDWAKRTDNDNIKHTELEQVKRTLNNMVQSVYSHGAIEYNSTLARIAEELEPELQAFRSRCEEVIAASVRRLGNAFDRDTTRKNKQRKKANKH